jgi:outer membrane protein insertion porin family
LGLRYERIKLNRIREDAPSDVKDLEGNNFVHSIKGSINYREVDRPFLPMKGYTTFLRYEYAGDFLGGDFNFSKAIIGGTVYLPAFETESGVKHVLSLRASLGWEEPHGATDEMPIFERFFVGGVSGTFPLRGFRYRGVGPHEGDTPLGGDAAISASLNYSIPLISDYDPFLDHEEDRLRGVIFFDVGNVVSKITEQSLFHRMRSAYGAGVQLNLPVLGGLPISIYYGIPWKIYPEDERRSFNIDISTGF